MQAPVRRRDPVSEAAAKKAAAPVLRRWARTTPKLDAGQVMGARRAVNAEPEVGGLPMTAGRPVWSSARGAMWSAAAVR